MSALPRQPVLNCKRDVPSSSGSTLCYCERQKLLQISERFPSGINPYKHFARMSEFAVYETIVRSRSPASDSKPTASQKLRDTLDDSALPRYHMSYSYPKREPGCVNRILHAIPPVFYVAAILCFLFTTLVVGSCLANANAKNESLRQGVEALALRLELFRTPALDASTEISEGLTNPLIDQHLEALDAFLTNASEWRSTAEALKAQKDEVSTVSYRRFALPSMPIYLAFSSSTNGLHTSSCYVEFLSEGRQTLKAPRSAMRLRYLDVVFLLSCFVSRF